MDLRKRTKLPRLAWMLSVALAGLVGTVTARAELPGASAAGRAPGQELIEDPAFQRGARVVAPTGPVVEQAPIGPMRVGTAAADPLPPAWRLAQWNSRTTLAGVPPMAMGSGGTKFRTETKSVEFGPVEGALRGLYLAMRGGAEYGRRMRRPEEPWPHLLVEQSFTNPPAIGELSRLEFTIECRLRHVATNAPAPLEAWHCAQFQAFLTVQNLKQGSPGYGDFLWFGIPFYDSRYRQPVAHAARDTAGSGKFIYTPAGAEYLGRASLADGDWVRVSRDLLPLIRDGLERAWREGLLTKSRDLADYRVTGINLGWELTGPLDVEMGSRDLSLRAVGR